MKKKYKSDTARVLSFLMCFALINNVDIPIHAAEKSKSSTIPVNVTVPANPINVTLPTSIDLVFGGADVNAQVANNYSITNNSKIGNIQVSNLKANVKESGWIMSSKSENSYFEQLPLDSKEIYLGFSTDGATFSIVDNEGIDPGIQISPVGMQSTQNFELESKTGGVSTSIISNLVDLEFTIRYQTAEVSIISFTINAIINVTAPQGKTFKEIIDENQYTMTGGGGYSLSYSGNTVNMTTSTGMFSLKDVSVNDIIEANRNYAATSSGMGA